MGPGDEGVVVAPHQLHDLHRALEADASPLGEEWVVVAAVQVLPPERELVEPRLALLGGEDEAPIPHEARGELLVQQEGQLANAPGLTDEEVRVRLHPRRGPGGPAIVDAAVDVAASAGEDEAAVRREGGIEIVDQDAVRSVRCLEIGDRLAGAPVGVHPPEPERLRGRAPSGEGDAAPIPAHRGGADVEVAAQPAPAQEAGRDVQSQRAVGGDRAGGEAEIRPTPEGVEVERVPDARGPSDPDHPIDDLIDREDLTARRGLLALDGVPASDDAIGRDLVEVAAIGIEPDAIVRGRRVQHAARGEVLEERAATVGDALTAIDLCGGEEVLGHEAPRVRARGLDGEQLPRHLVVPAGGDAREHALVAAPEAEVVKHRWRVAVHEHAALADQHRLHPVREEAKPRVRVRVDQELGATSRQVLRPARDDLVALVVGAGEDVAALVEAPPAEGAQRTAEQAGGGDRGGHVGRADEVVPADLFVGLATGEVEVGQRLTVAIAPGAGLAEDRLDLVSKTLEGDLVVDRRGRVEAVESGDPSDAIAAVRRERLVRHARSRCPRFDPSLQLGVAGRAHVDERTGVVADIGLDPCETLAGGRVRIPGLDGDLDVVAALQEQGAHRVRAVGREHVVPAHQRVEAGQIEVARRAAVLVDVTAVGLLCAADVQDRVDPLVVIGRCGRRDRVTRRRAHRQDDDGREWGEMGTHRRRSYHAGGRRERWDQRMRRATSMAS